MRRSVSSRRPVATAGPLRSSSLASRAGLVALAASLVLAGCGGDDPSADLKPESTTPSSPAEAAFQGEAPTKEQEAGIQETNAAAYTAVKNKDGAAFCKLLTKQSIEILTSGSTEKGTAAKKCATIATKIAEGVKPDQVTPERLTSIKVNGDRAVGQASGRVTSFELVDGKWLLGVSQGAPDTQETTP
jgi:hypothetical protein